MDVATTLIALKQAGTQQLVQIAILRKAHQMDTDLLAVIDETMAKAPTLAGAGRLVDKHA